MKWQMSILVSTFLFVRSSLRADVTLADFESPQPMATSANLVGRQIDADSPQGRSHLQLTMKPDELQPGIVRLPLHPPTGFAGSDRLTAQVRVYGKAGVKVLRWVALDEHGTPIFQRRFELKPGEQWVRLDEPLRNWRWHDAHAGDWSDVRELSLRIETPTDEVDLDDIRLIGSATPKDRTDWLLHLAFEDRPNQRSEDSGMLVATDVVAAFTDADRHSLLINMLHIRAWVRQVFATAAAPIEGEGPVMLLIFSDDKDRQAFFRRLGEQWRATLDPPPAQGFTVQDICSSTYAPATGAHRPVYLHEAVHAIVARELRLPSGYAAYSPLQEGLANYLQLCVYPQSLPRSTFTINFNKPIDPAGKGFFKPLPMLFERRATAEHYAQLASFVAYLVEKNPSFLNDLAAGLREDRKIPDILSRHATDWRSIEGDWLDWGRARFAPGSANQPLIFDCPAEFR